MLKTTITKIYRSDKKKDGTPLINKNGNAYEKISIQTNQNGDKWVGGFSNETNKAWNVGDSVDIDVTQNGDWLNFKEVKATDGISKTDFEKLESRVSNLEKRIALMGTESKADEIDLGKIPF